MFVGHQKGAEVNENIRRNFGMPHPEGYRKAIRLYRLAERLQLPVVTFVDTPGAFPGPASEERGVAEAIARSIMVMAGLRTPIVTVITGEGGSGGALALAVGDVVLALENAIYSVISPEGCGEHPVAHRPITRQQAAVAMRLTAAEQLALGVIDEVVPEPAAARTSIPTRPRATLQCAHRAPPGRASPAAIGRVLLDARYARYRRMGEFATVSEEGESKPRAWRLGRAHQAAARERPRRDQRTATGWARCRRRPHSTKNQTCRCARTFDDGRRRAARKDGEARRTIAPACRRHAARASSSG